MPKLVADYTAEETKAKKGVRGQLKADLLGPYMELLAPVEAGASREVELDAGETQRVAKRRFTGAAKQLGKNITWRTAPAGHLLFEVTLPKTPSAPGTRKGGRPKKQAASA